MRSFKLGRLFGISIELHSTFVLLAIIVAALLLLTQPQNFLPTIILFFFLFLTVFFHELMHSVVAMQKGCKVEKIILLPIGGISVSEELPEKPADEFLIAVVGPLFNFIVAAAILLLVHFAHAPFPQNWLQLFFFSPMKFEEALLAYPLLGLFYVNLLLGAFNLFLPALPLDGGRVARAILASIFGFKKATDMITKLSVFVAIFLFLLGFFSGSILIAVIAVFIYFGAKQEQEAAAMKQALERETIKSLINKKPFIAKGSATVAEIAALMQKRNQLHFLVQLEKNKFGLIGIDSIVSIDKSKWHETKAESVCKPVNAVNENAPASEVAVKLFGKGIAMLPVARKGKFIGVIEARELQKRVELNKVVEKK